MIKKVLFTNYLLFISLSLYAHITVPRIFSDHMVLQRGEPISLYGKADVGEQVEAQFMGQTQTTQTDLQGNWRVVFPSADAGGPYQITLKGKNSLSFNNVYVGEVWFCSGQSNMAWRLDNSLNAADEVAHADYEGIKLFSVSKRMSNQPETTLEKGSWQTCTPQNTKGFSALAYFFGRALHQKYGVPIGLIHASWGGTSIETWMPAHLFEGYPKQKDKLKTMKEVDLQNALQQYYKDKDAYIVTLDSLDHGQRENWENPTVPFPLAKEMTLPALWRTTPLQQRYGVVWLRKSITLEEKDLTDILTLSLGRIDHNDITYVNGHKVGATENKGTDRLYPIPKHLLKPGTNWITVRAKNHDQMGGFRSAQAELYLQTPIRRIPLHGVWAFRVGTPDAPAPPDVQHPNLYPSSLYNGMVNPWLGYKIRGAIWYQGESNAWNPDEYAQFFPAMVSDWRKAWKKDFPFLFVQLANYEKQEGRWPWIREAQTAALKLEQTAMATTIDIGNDANIHPANKQEVGRRLALAAMQMVYNEKGVATPPRIKTVKTRGDKILVKFDVPLTLKGDNALINGFQIAGEDKKFVNAQAQKVKGSALEIAAKEVKAPQYIRYLWEDAPGKVMVYGPDGLPVPPFRTDR